MVYNHTKGVTVPAMERWRKQLIFGMAAVFIAGLSAFSLSASAETAKVKNISTGKTFPTIQAAIDAEATVEGNIIEVPNGTYAPFIVDKDDNITIRAAAGASPKVKGKVSADSIRIIDVRADGVTIEGLTVTLPEPNGQNKDWSKHLAPELDKLAPELDKIDPSTITPTDITDAIDKNIPSLSVVLNPATAVRGMIGVSISGQDATIRGNTITGKLLAVHTGSTNIEGNATIEDNKINAYIGFGFQNTANTVRHNDVKTSLVGVASMMPGNMIEFNNFVSVSGLGALAFSSVELNVTKNWWGSTTGIGLTLFENVVATPWLCQPFQDGETLSVDGNCVPVDEPEVPPTEPAPDTLAPIVALSAPTDGAVLSGMVTFTGTATDELNASHYFAVRDLSTDDATIVRQSDKMSATDPEVAASYAFDTTGLRDGDYRVVLVGDDTAGNSGRVGANVVFENFVDNKAECADNGWQRGTFEGRNFGNQVACEKHFTPKGHQGGDKPSWWNWNIWGWGWADISRGVLTAFLGIRW